MIPTASTIALSSRYREKNVKKAPVRNSRGASLKVFVSAVVSVYALLWHSNRGTEDGIYSFVEVDIGGNNAQYISESANR